VKAISTNYFGLAGIGGTNYAGVYGATVDGLLYLQNSGLNGYSHLGYGASGLSDSGIGLVGYATTNRAWGGYMVGKFAVQGNVTPSGDTLVQLPDNSIDAQEILDEPGIANVDEGAFSSHLVSSYTYAPIDSVVINCPAAGYIAVDAGGIAHLTHTVGTASDIWFWVDETQISPSYYGFQTCTEPSAAPSSDYYLNFHSHWVYATGSGTRKFYLMSYNNSSIAQITYSNWVSAVYYPTAYGAVSSTVPEAAAGDFSVTSTFHPGMAGNAPETQPTATLVQIDLRELELRAAKARAEAERADRLLIEARLKNELRKGESGDH
jgi:hypothetical protein